MKMEFTKSFSYNLGIMYYSPIRILGNIEEMSEF